MQSLILVLFMQWPLKSTQQFLPICIIMDTSMCVLSKGDVIVHRKLHCSHAVVPEGKVLRM